MIGDLLPVDVRPPTHVLSCLVVSVAIINPSVTASRSILLTRLTDNYCRGELRITKHHDGFLIR